MPVNDRLSSDLNWNCFKEMTEPTVKKMVDCEENEVVQQLLDRLPDFQGSKEEVLMLGCRLITHLHNPEHIDQISEAMAEAGAWPDSFWQRTGADQIAIVSMVKNAISFLNWRDPQKDTILFDSFYQAVQEGNTVAALEILDHLPFITEKMSAKISQGSALAAVLTHLPDDALLYEVQKKDRSSNARAITLPLEELSAALILKDKSFWLTPVQKLTDSERASRERLLDTVGMIPQENREAVCKTIQKLGLSPDYYPEEVHHIQDLEELCKEVLKLVSSETTPLKKAQALIDLAHIPKNERQEVLTDLHSQIMSFELPSETILSVLEMVSISEWKEICKLAQSFTYPSPNALQMMLEGLTIIPQQKRKEMAPLLNDCITLHAKTITLHAKTLEPYKTWDLLNHLLKTPSDEWKDILSMLPITKYYDSQTIDDIRNELKNIPKELRGKAIEIALRFASSYGNFSNSRNFIGELCLLPQEKLADVIQCTEYLGEMDDPKSFLDAAVCLVEVPEEERLEVLELAVLLSTSPKNLPGNIEKVTEIPQSGRAEIRPFAQEFAKHGKIGKAIEQLSATSEKYVWVDRMHQLRTFEASSYSSKDFLQIVSLSGEHLEASVKDMLVQLLDTRKKNDVIKHFKDLINHFEIETSPHLALLGLANDYVVSQAWLTKLKTASVESTTPEADTTGEAVEDPFITHYTEERWKQEYTRRATELKQTALEIWKDIPFANEGAENVRTVFLEVDHSLYEKKDITLAFTTVLDRIVNKDVWSGTPKEHQPYQLHKFYCAMLKNTETIVKKLHEKLNASEPLTPQELGWIRTQAAGHLISLATAAIQGRCGTGDQVEIEQATEVLLDKPVNVGNLPTKILQDVVERVVADEYEGDAHYVSEAKYAVGLAALPDESSYAPQAITFLRKKIAKKFTLEHLCEEFCSRASFEKTKKWLEESIPEDFEPEIFHIEQEMLDQEKPIMDELIQILGNVAQRERVVDSFRNYEGNALLVPEDFQGQEGTLQQQVRVELEKNIQAAARAINQNVPSQVIEEGLSIEDLREKIAGIERSLTRNLMQQRMSPMDARKALVPLMKVLNSVPGQLKAVEQFEKDAVRLNLSPEEKIAALKAKSVYDQKMGVVIRKLINNELEIPFTPSEFALPSQACKLARTQKYMTQFPTPAQAWLQVLLLTGVLEKSTTSGGGGR